MVAPLGMTSVAPRLVDSIPLVKHGVGSQRKSSESTGGYGSMGGHRYGSANIEGR